MIGVPLAAAIPLAVLALLGLVQAVIVFVQTPRLVREELRRRSNAAQWAANSRRWEETHGA